MKKFLLLTLPLGVFIVLSMSSGVVQNDALPSTLGVLLGMDSACNDHYFVANMMDTNIYELHGYEYGCGSNDRISWGTLHIYGGVAYFAWQDNNPGNDYGTIGTFAVPISLSTKTGTGTYMYIYSTSGVLSSHGGSMPYSVSQGSDPNSTTPVYSPDISIK